MTPTSMSNTYKAVLMLEVAKGTASFISNEIDDTSYDVKYFKCIYYECYK